MLPKLPRLRVKTHRDGSVSYWFDHGGRPRRWELLGRAESAARRRYDELISLKRGTTDEMLRETINSLRGKVAQGTLANYETYRKHLAAVFGAPETITQADVLKYMRLCPRMTFRNEISLLSQGFVHWMDEGRLTFNPCFGVTIKRKQSHRTRLLLPAEIEAILAKADERLAVAIELAYATGLRIGDLCRLRWADLSGIFRAQKTDAPLEIAPADALTAILDRARALQSRVGSLYVICDYRGRQRKTGTLRDQWNAAVATSGVQDANFHDLRAAGATKVEKLYGLDAAREFLGHKDIKTTMLYLRGLRVSTIRPIARQA